MIQCFNTMITIIKNDLVFEKVSFSLKVKIIPVPSNTSWKLNYGTVNIPHKLSIYGRQ